MNKVLKQILQFGAGTLYFAKDGMDQVFDALKQEEILDEKKSKKVVKKVVKQAKAKVKKFTEDIKDAVKRDEPVQNNTPADQSTATEEPTVKSTTTKKTTRKPIVKNEVDKA